MRWRRHCVVEGVWRAVCEKRRTGRARGRDMIADVVVWVVGGGAVNNNWIGMSRSLEANDLRRRLRGCVSSRMRMWVSTLLYIS